MRIVCFLVPLSSLVQDDIYDLVMLADILGRNGHELVDDFTEQVDISTRVALNAGNEICRCILVLVPGACELCIKNGTE